MTQKLPSSTPNKPAPTPSNSNDLVDIQKTETKPVNGKPILETKADKPAVLQRRYQENMSFFSDLFRLQVSKMLQWKGWTKISKNAPRDEHGNLNEDWFFTEHCHYFHTIDSNGKVQEYCQPVGQHVHKINVVRDSNDSEDIISVKCVSGPLKWEISEKFGKRKRILVEDPNDNHRHEMIYLKSNKLLRPDMNAEAAKVMGRAQQNETSKVVFDEDGKQLDNLALR